MAGLDAATSAVSPTVPGAASTTTSTSSKTSKTSRSSRAKHDRAGSRSKSSKDAAAAAAVDGAPGDVSSLDAAGLVSSGVAGPQAAAGPASILSSSAAAERPGAFELAAQSGIPGAPQPSPLDAGFSSSLPPPWSGTDLGRLDLAPLGPLPEVEAPAKAVKPAEVDAIPQDPSLPSLRERAHVAMRASGAAMEAAQRASAYSAAASSAASRAAEAAEQAAVAAAAVQIALHEQMFSAREVLADWVASIWAAIVGGRTVMPGSGGTAMVPGRGMGMGGMMGARGMGMMRGGGGGQQFMATIHSLLANHNAVNRVYYKTSTGIKSTTESEDPLVAGWIQQHVKEMEQLLHSCATESCPAMPHGWDPLFNAVYRNAANIDLKVINTRKGVFVEETGKDAAAAALVQAHAAVVSGFAKYGMAEAMRAHPLPAAAAAAGAAPRRNNV
eukprot:gene10889-11044_t